MACIINAESGTGLTNSADGSGIIKLQSAGKTTNALAWVNFNGTGTVAIRSSYNVSSITDNGTGDYTVNFATALSDANYSAVSTLFSDRTGTGTYGLVAGVNTLATGSFQLDCLAGAGAWAYFDPSIVCVSVFGN